MGRSRSVLASIPYPHLACACAGSMLLGRSSSRKTWAGQDSAAQPVSDTQGAHLRWCRRSVRVVVVVGVVAVVVALGSLCQGLGACGDLIRGHGGQAGEHVLQGGQPEPVIVVRLAPGRSSLPDGDPGDQCGLEFRPCERACLVQGDGHTEGAALPRLGEHQLAVGAGGCGRALDVQRRVHGATAFATPTIASLVTSGTSSSSDSCPVPAGRSGSTSQRTSLVESRTVICTSSARSRPISDSTLRGSLTIRAR